MTDIPSAEIIVVLAVVLLLLVYHVHLVITIRKRPLTTALGLTHHLRRRWVATIMADKRDILPVQTLRNWTMAANFLASTALLIVLATVNATLSPDKVSKVVHALNVIGSTSDQLLLVKLILLILNFFFSFFNFCLTIRYYNHVGFIINVPDDADEHTGEEAVAHILNLGATHYTLGMRGYYLAVPLTLWLFGPIWMLGGTVLLVGFLYKLDRTA